MHMNIEIHAPHGQVKEWVIEYTRDQLLKLHKQDKEISRAQVYFREPAEENNGGKICEIQLTIPGGDLFIHRQAENFEKAVRNVLEEITEMVIQQLKMQN